MRVKGPRVLQGLATAGAFVLGFLFCGAALYVALRPAETYAAWCRLRYGAVPSAGGLVLTLEPASEEARGTGPGPWVLLRLLNASDAPLVLPLPDVLGDEVGFRVRAPDGAVLPPARGPGEATVMREPHPTVLPPGASLGLVADVSSHVEVPPGPGTYTVEAALVLWLDPRRGDEPHRCLSNALTLELSR